MPIVCKIFLDAEEYRQKLAQVIAETKKGAGGSDRLANSGKSEPECNPPESDSVE